MNTEMQKESILELPEGFTARGANLNDAEEAVLLFNRWSQSIVSHDEFTDPEVLRTDWQSPGFDLESDTRLVLASNGELAGYIEVWTTAKPPVHPWIWGRVDPKHEDQGIGTWMLQWAEEHASQVIPTLPTDLRFALHVATYRESEKTKKLFEELGYCYIRSSYHMLIEMDGPVPKPEFPADITLRTYQPGRDAEAVYRAQRDSFRDHFGYLEQPFEEGLKHFKHFWESESADPTLIFIAMDGDAIAGISLCLSQSFDDPEKGWVSTLAVRRPWRKRGIGLALLRHSFNELYRRGKRKVGLGVDSQNLTGALRLYENAGMYVQQAFDRYEKELRPGKEISVQFLSE